MVTFNPEDKSTRKDNLIEAVMMHRLWEQKKREVTPAKRARGSNSEAGKLQMLHDILGKIPTEHKQSNNQVKDKINIRKNAHRLGIGELSKDELLSHDVDPKLKIGALKHIEKLAARARELKPHIDRFAAYGVEPEEKPKTKRAKPESEPEHPIFKQSNLNTSSDSNRSTKSSVSRPVSRKTFDVDSDETGSRYDWVKPSSPSKTTVGYKRHFKPKHPYPDAPEGSFPSDIHAYISPKTPSPALVWPTSKKPDDTLSNRLGPDDPRLHSLLKQHPTLHRLIVRGHDEQASKYVEKLPNSAEVWKALGHEPSPHSKPDTSHLSGGLDDDSPKHLHYTRQLNGKSAVVHDARTHLTPLKLKVKDAIDDYVNAHMERGPTHPVTVLKHRDAQRTRQEYDNKHDELEQRALNVLKRSGSIPSTRADRYDGVQPRGKFRNPSHPDDKLPSRAGNLIRSVLSWRKKKV